MRFIHCADLHLDSPLRGLNHYEGAPVEQMRAATRHAFINVINLTLEREADCLLIAGDVFDGDWKDFNTGLFFANQLRRLTEVGIKIFIVLGNHDALGNMTRRVPWPKGTHLFRADKVETVVDEKLGLAVHGQSFAESAVMVDLAQHYPVNRPGFLNVGLLHTALSGREGHAPYAPTTVNVLSEKGYDYWALGHVHTREIISEKPWIVFPGNTQGRHARETGAKGCLVVEGDAEDGIRSVEFVATDVARWFDVQLDVTALSHLDELQLAVQTVVREAVRETDERLLALRLTLRGRTALHSQLVNRTDSLRADLCAWLNEASAGLAWLEKISLRVDAPLDLAVLARRDDPFGLLVRMLDELSHNPDQLNRLAHTATEELEQRIPPELRDDPGLNGLSRDEVHQEALILARERLLAHLSLEGTP